MSFLSVRKALPESVRGRIRSKLNFLKALFFSAFSRSGWLASLYYLLFSREFDREHLSVLKGKMRYSQLLSDVKHSSPLLRRNIHRIEKGLIMRPRRQSFATDFIGETVRAYKKAVISGNHCEHEGKWASDVLREYFKIVDVSHKSIGMAFNEYKKIPPLPELVDDIPFVPYKYSDLAESDISFCKLETLFRKRRSVRWFIDRPVPIEEIYKAVDIASQAPSACNRQPYRFIVANNKSLAASIAACAGGTKGFAQNIPCLILVVGNLSSYPEERDRHLIYVDSGLAVMQLMLALETLGLSTCPINWPDVSESELKLQKIVALPQYERVVMLMAVGFADTTGGIAFSQKKNHITLVEVLE
jgi:nitroreductase